LPSESEKFMPLYSYTRLSITSTNWYRYFTFQDDLRLVLTCLIRRVPDIDC